MLDPGYFLPLLTVSANKLDAVRPGLKWLEKRSNPTMAHAAAKIEAVLPRWAQDIADTLGEFVWTAPFATIETISTELFRDAVRGQVLSVRGSRVTR